MSEKTSVLLVVSFGSSYNDTRESTIGAIEKALQQANPEYELRRAFTSQTVINIIEERENIDINNVSQAMQRIVNDGIKQLVIQPTHIMLGKEYDDIIYAIRPYAKKFDSIRIGAPLLTDDTDFDALAAALTEESKRYNADGSVIVYVGHGTRHTVNEIYSKLQKKLFEKGHTNCFIGTLESSPTIEDVIELINKSTAKKAVLLPLMIVSGRHACKNIAGDQDSSWKSQFENAGYEVECILKGLGEYRSVQQIFIEHAANAKGLSNA